MTEILDGKKLRDKIFAGLKTKLDRMSEKATLAVILAGNDPASQIYVRNKKKTAENLGINSIVIEYPADVTETELLAKISELNNDKKISAILVQLPLPKQIDKFRIIDAILPQKDVDGLTPYNLGKLFAGEQPYVYPCTPKGILLLLDEYGINPAEKHVVVIGRSNLVGKPVAQMLLQRNATVTMCHSHTTNLPDITKTADIVVSAVGKNIIGEKMLKSNCVVVDVGIYRDETGKVRGDVDFEGVSNIAAYISPVPGGVGPMTIASLMLNTVELFERNKQSL